MSKCYNCGCDIDPEDKTRLCDKCKKIILPFVKFMDASTSSAVRRLIQNERNLRNAGVTDGGMEYLLKICEIHDKKKLREKEEREAKKAAEAESVTHEEEGYSEVELPMDEPLDLIHKPYGSFLPAAEAVFILAGAALLVFTVYGSVANGNFSIPSLCGAIASFAGAYLSDCARRMIHDLDEIKKRFR